MWGSHELKGHAHGHPKIIEATSSFLEFVPACKKLVFSIFFFLETKPIFESHDQTSHTNFWICPFKKFRPTFNFREFVLTCKKSADLINLFWINSWLNNPTIWSDWMRAFWSKPQKNDFSQILELWRNTANNMNVYHRPNSGKISDQIFQLVKKTILLVYYPNFRGKNFSPKKSSSVANNFICVSSTMP